MPEVCQFQPFSSCEKFKEVDMGKMADKRRKHRVNRLIELARQDMDLFSRDWQMLLDSWCLEIRKRAGVFIDDENGKRMPAAFIIVRAAINDLAQCGEEVFVKWAEATKEILIGE